MWCLILAMTFAARPDFGMIQPSAPRTAWTTDYAAACTRADREEKPLLIFFSEEWCYPCKMMKLVFKHESLEGLARSHVLCYLTMSRNLTVVRKYNMGRATPAFALVGPDGEVRRLVGYVNAAVFKRWLDKTER